MGARVTGEAAAGRDNRKGPGRVSLGLSLISFALYAPLLLMSLYFWRHPQSVPDSPGLGLYMLLAPLVILALPLFATPLGLWCLLRKGRDRRHAAGGLLLCAAVLLVVGVVTPWVAGTPTHVFRMAVYPESLDPTPDPTQWVRGQEYELVSRPSPGTLADIRP